MRKFIAVGCGDESPFFKEAAKLWKNGAYLNDWELFIVQWGRHDQNTEFILSDRTLFIKPPDMLSDISNDSSRYQLTGQWSALERRSLVYRKIAFSRFLIDFCERDFVLYHSTLNTVTSFPALDSLLLKIAHKDFVLGQFITQSRGGDVFFVPSGAGHVMSRSLVYRLADSRELSEELEDVYSGRVCQDMPLFSFPRYDLISLGDVNQLRLDSLEDIQRIKRAINAGFPSIRIKLSNNRVHERHLMHHELSLISIAHYEINRVQHNPLRYESLLRIVKE